MTCAECGSDYHECEKCGREYFWHDLECSEAMCGQCARRSRTIDGDLTVTMHELNEMMKKRFPVFVAGTLTIKPEWSK